jgi:enoyl-CoA hydratase
VRACASVGEESPKGFAKAMWTAIERKASLGHRVAHPSTVAGDASTFGYPEIDVGLIPAIHFVQLPRLIGKHQAFGPLFLGDSFDAATAYRMGLLSEVVPKGAALDRAREVGRRLAAKSSSIMKIGRDAFMRAIDADFRRSVENAAESFALVATTEDCQEGLNAFVEKRVPSYRGR